MDTSKLERDMKQWVAVAEKIQALLPEMQQIPIIPILLYQGTDTLVFNVRTWNDWKIMRRHFGKRLKPTRHHLSKEDRAKPAAWMHYILDNELHIILTVELST